MSSEDRSASLLARVAQRRADADEAERDVVRLAVRYAAQHPAPGAPEDDRLHGDQPLQLAGPGAPGIAEFAVAEFAAVLGMSTSAGRAFLGQALELRHLLPELWGRLERGEMAAWRARMIADRTIHLSQSAARWLDAHIAPIADRLGAVRLQRLIDHARLLADETAVERSDAARASCSVIVDTRDATSGVAYVDASLDVADALDLDRALKVASAALASAGDPDPLGVRRSRALGLIARTYFATADDAPRAPARPMQIYVHYTPGCALGRAGRAVLENSGGLVSTEQVASWCAQPGATVRVTPVIDLADELSSAGYAPASSLREQTVLRFHSCAFPDCNRRSRSADLDHIVPFDEAAPPGGPPQTTSSNLAPGVLLWTSPDGRRYLRTHALTVALT